MGLAPWFTVEDAYRWMHTLQHSLCMFSARKCLVRMFAHVLLGIVWCHCLTLSVLETNKIEARCKSPGWYCLNMDIVSTDLLSIYCSISFIYESHGVAKNARTTRNWHFSLNGGENECFTYSEKNSDVLWLFRFCQVIQQTFLKHARTLALITDSLCTHGMPENVKRVQRLRGDTGCGDFLRLRAKSDENKQAYLVFHVDFKYAIIFLVGSLIQEIDKAATLLFPETVEKKLLSRKWLLHS